MISLILQNHENAVMRHVKYLKTITTAIAMDTMCTLPPDKHALTHRKSVL